MAMSWNSHFQEINVTDENGDNQIVPVIQNYILIQGKNKNDMEAEN